MNFTFLRLAAVHTPMTEFCFVGSVGLMPPAVSWSFGICNAREWTFKVLVELMPAMADRAPVTPNVAWNCWNGRSVPRSKMDPRST